MKDDGVFNCGNWEAVGFRKCVKIEQNLLIGEMSMGKRSVKQDFHPEVIGECSCHLQIEKNDRGKDPFWS